MSRAADRRARPQLGLELRCPCALRIDDEVASAIAASARLASSPCVVLRVQAGQISLSRPRADRRPDERPPLRLLDVAARDLRASTASLHERPRRCRAERTRFGVPCGRAARRSGRSCAQQRPNAGPARAIPRRCHDLAIEPRDPAPRSGSHSSRSSSSRVSEPRVRCPRRRPHVLACRSDGSAPRRCRRDLPSQLRRGVELASPRSSSPSSVKRTVAYEPACASASPPGTRSGRTRAMRGEASSAVAGLTLPSAATKPRQLRSGGR